MASLLDMDEEDNEDEQDFVDLEEKDDASDGNEVKENEENIIRSVNRMASTKNEKQLQPPKTDENVEMMALFSPQHQSMANTNAVMASKGHVTLATLEAEVQCIICRYALFKPVSVVCGHSFCRVCLLDSLLTRPLEEAQCPICRVDILLPFAAKATLASMFSINVTLWNLVQLLVPTVAERKVTYQQEEDREFEHKIEQLDVKRKISTLGERAASYHGDEGHERLTGRWEEDRGGHEEYPVLKVEDTDDGELHVSRTVVLDTSDENEDGYANMRVGIAIVEFPSILESYNEHQECSVNVIKMEEDEEIADGMPFFMNDDGDDDALVCSSYCNEISLRVCDEAGNCVMERTRGAQGGAVTFPALRLDVPGGVYTFRFSDNLYGLKLSITTRLREPHEISDTPVADYVSLIHDEARDASRRNRHAQGHDSDCEGEFSEEANESDDSFIVDDLNETEQPTGDSNSDEYEDYRGFHSDDEAAVGRDSQDEESLCGNQGEQEDSDVDDHELESDGEERTGSRSVRVVEDGVFSGDEETDQKGHDDVAEESDNDEEQPNVHQVARPRRRKNANQILDSEDEDVHSLIREQSEDEGEGTSLSIAVEDPNSEEDAGVASRCSRKGPKSQDEDSDDVQQQVLESKAMSHPDQVDKSPESRLRKRARTGQLINEVKGDKELRPMERSVRGTEQETGCMYEDNDEGEEVCVELQARQLDQFDDNTLEAEDAMEEEDDGEEVAGYEEEDDENEEVAGYGEDEDEVDDCEDGDGGDEKDDDEDGMDSDRPMATTEEVSFAQGMFVTLWPKVERCHDYIELLLSAQEKLQHTVDQLIAGLQEVEKAETCSIQRYADRLRNFPARVEGLEKKLLMIKARLAAMKKSQSHGVRTTAKLSTEESAFYTTTPLF